MPPQFILILKQRGARDLIAKAKLNLALAELEASTLEAVKVVQDAIFSSEDFNQPDIKLLRQQVFKKLEDRDLKKVHIK